MFAAHLGAPCTVLNDAQAAMHGEAWRGAARGLSDVLMVTLGTGIGAGLMLGGTVRRGSHGSAGEIGAWQLTGDQSFEEFASPANFERRTGSRLGDAIVAGDPNSSAVLDVLGRHIGAVHMLLDLQAIVVGGRIVAAGEPLRAGIETAIRRHCASPLLHDLKVVISALGPYAGAIGAVAPSAIGAGE
jgi:glucokinase